MGLAVRIIPTLLKRGPHLVKGRQFSADRVVGHVQQAARIHQARGVDELCILDIEATKKGRGPDFAAIEQLTAECFMPLTVGGGVRSVEDVERLLRAGADKVAVNTLWDANPDLFVSACDRFGSQAIVGVVDHRDDYVASLLRAQGMENYGAGELLVTSVEREGAMEGYDLKLISMVTFSCGVPVIAHGGCGTPQHALEAVRAGASAVAIGSMFLFTDETPASVARYLNDNGVEVRL